MSIEEADSASLKKTIADARAEVERAKGEVDEAKAAQGEVKVARGKLEVQVEAAIKAITADGKTVLEEALSLPAPDDRAACERELADLARQINNLGPVNQVAFEEISVFASVRIMLPLSWQTSRVPALRLRRFLRPSTERCAVSS